jgi:glycosyltransferase involved in cell wall biosynthesis
MTASNNSPAAREAAEAAYRLAKVWQTKGRNEHALAGYQKVLALQPDHVEAHAALIKICLQNGRWPEAMNWARRALEIDPNEARFHKGLVSALAEQGKLDEACRFYELSRKDSKPVVMAPDDILCCCVVRNELPRLPYFLAYYRQKGVAKFLFIDNGSTDGTVEYLLNQPDAYVWQSAYSFNKANFGAGWFEPLLRKYGLGHWCLIVDADELLYYFDCENKNLVQLCGELERRNQKAFPANLLDMYSEKPVRDTHYESGQNFLEVCSYFDRQFYHAKFNDSGPYRNQPYYFGGMRQRVFGAAADYLLSKVPLIKYNAEVVLSGGQHWTSCAKAEIAAESGALLHFKYFASFHQYVQREIQRKEHYFDAWQYQQYAQTLARNDAITLYDPAHSVKLQGSHQLARLGIIQIDESAKPSLFKFPPISPLPKNLHRPFWSVMITTYNRVQYLEQALRSVIEQSPDPEEMQIEVINDGAPAAIQDGLAAIIKAVGGSRVHFHRHSQNLGHPEIFNLCLQRAHGHWIHLLHDDDWIAPEFYHALRRGISQAPEIGAAFCRQVYVTERGEQRWLSRLERETPGVVADWLERLAVFCRLQTPAIVVKREAYERLGGFCAAANSAFDWEMWKRIARHYPFWYEPRPLAYFREHEMAESSHLIASGRQIADTRRAIEISQTYLPEKDAGRLSEQARRHYAIYALEIAGKLLRDGKAEAALANICEGLRCSQAQKVKDMVIALLLNVDVHPLGKLEPEFCTSLCQSRD